MNVVAPLTTFAGDTAYDPGASPWKTCVAVSAALNPPGPVTEPCADTPAGSPDTTTLSAPVVGAGGARSAVLVDPPHVQPAQPINSHRSALVAEEDRRA